MNMTRKDYVAIARAFARTMPTVADFTRTSADGQNTFTNHISYDAAYGAWSETVRAVADVMGADNPRFDRLRFLYAASNGPLDSDLAEHPHLREILEER